MQGRLCLAPRQSPLARLPAPHGSCCAADRLCRAALPVGLLGMKPLLEPLNAQAFCLTASSSLPPLPLPLPLHSLSCPVSGPPLPPPLHPRLTHPSTHSATPTPNPHSTHTFSRPAPPRPAPSTPPPCTPPPPPPPSPPCRKCWTFCGSGSWRRGACPPRPSPRRSTSSCPTRRPPPSPSGCAPRSGAPWRTPRCCWAAGGTAWARGRGAAAAGRPSQSLRFCSRSPPAPPHPQSLPLTALRGASRARSQLPRLCSAPRPQPPRPSPSVHLSLILQHL